MSEKPLVGKAWSVVMAEMVAALEADPIAREGVDLAHRAVEAGDDAALAAHVMFVAARVAPRAPILPEEDWREVLLSGVQGRPRRVGQVPGIPGRNVWVIVDEADATALRTAIEPGQVWVRTDLLKSAEAPTVLAHARHAQENMLGKVRPPGRRPGSTNRARTAMLNAISKTPGMTDAEIDALGVELGYADPALDDVEAAERAKRLRREAKRINR